ncbi:hypothetical protein THRCLA_22155 [Thraustotheca clavata]|uniref:Uncharacterized protein n=1 Tax=Thraustotheca clavata TaxID=74557 RepID=A0A1V9ZBI6_9STRA|nr:hypothetical protein THRCLA_22155 [Thraustotheca clavata]
MPCSCVGLLSVLGAAVAVVLSAFAAGLPLWSLLAYSNNGQMTTATFTAGVWGYCTDVSFVQAGTNDYSSPTTKSSGQCYLYYSGNRNAHIVLNDSQGNSTIVQPTDGVCKMFNEDGGSSKRLMATVKDIDQTSFDTFLTNTCGAKGKVSLSFAMLSPIFGAFAFCILTAAVCCAKYQSCLVAFSAWMTVLSTICSIISFVVWNSQTPTGNGIMYGASYYMEIAATVCYSISCFFAVIHMQHGRKNNSQTHNSRATISLQAALEKQKKISLSPIPTRLV